uniref:Uncharacterized protein n=1 Tax=Euplotes crassus TaxID=5936 RepID=A0A7S3NYP9_EUPCR|mmetsp:Transcript_31466/g.30960  ORF Transcript_31466/g.30960 Transcript_31466/m.30960 type:complete len:124 (+) Transcript_31466:96-467(+)
MLKYNKKLKKMLANWESDKPKPNSPKRMAKTSHFRGKRFFTKRVSSNQPHIKHSQIPRWNEKELSPEIVTPHADFLTNDDMEYINIATHFPNVKTSKNRPSNVFRSVNVSHHKKKRKSNYSGY